MADNADQDWLDLLANIGNVTGQDFLQQYQDSGKLLGWPNLDPDMLKTLGVYAVATSSNPYASATTGIDKLNKGLWDTYGPLGLGFRDKTRKSNLAAMMLGYEDTGAAKKAGVMDTYGAYLEGILDDAEAMKQDSGGAGQTRVETIADQVEMGMLDFTSGDDWE